MHASRVAIVIVASLGAAFAIWRLRLPGEDAELAAMILAFIAGAAAGAALVRRRIVAGLITIVTAIGVWATTGGVEHDLDSRAQIVVGSALAVAMLALVFAGEPEAQAVEEPNESEKRDENQ
ncbi:MAG TPA: hypothetical protein VIA18_07275 [Polyangia bacterium]|nr:hypothetical protein [Polyangia bacterium]